MTNTYHHQSDSRLDTFYTKAAVMMTLCAIALVLITIFANITWLKALAGGLLFVTMFPTVVLWADIIEPLRRTCRACKRRGVTQGTLMVFDATESYDKWNYCRNCGAVYLHIGDHWVARCDEINHSEPSREP